MSEIKLFRLGSAGVQALAGASAQVEKSLQTLFESNLEALLGVKFLATEHSTGPVHGGRIDSLGLDENNFPMIIEYKRAVSQNVINQGLFYLDWLLDHKKDFEWLVLDKLSPEIAKQVDWSAPRLLCIAGDFTRHDLHAVKQIPRNIELLRYQRFGDDLLVLELVHAPAQVRHGPSTGSPDETTIEQAEAVAADDPYLSQRISYRISQADQATRDLYEALSQFLLGLGEDVQLVERQYYVAFKRIKNFACVEVYPQTRVVNVFLKVDPASVQIEEGFTRDMTGIGHWGTGDLQVSLKNMDDFARAQPLFIQSYEAG
jgi:predicted transport protein